MTTTYFSERILGRSPQRRRLTDREFSQLYERCGDALRAYIARVSGNSTLGEDIFQEACYRLLRSSLPEMTADELKAYAYRTATRLIYDSWRRSRPEIVEEDWDGMPHPERRCEVRHDVQKLFLELKARQRVLLWLAYVEGCNHNEIAERLGLGASSIRVLLFRARRKFAQVLSREGLSLEDFA